METSEILRRLQPIMPRRVARWQIALDVVDASTRKLIEQQVVLTARSVLGASFKDQLLLSLPPRKTAKGSLELGAVLYGSERWEFGIKPGELLQNLAIFGRSGAGKTNVVFQLLRELEKKRIPFLFLDWKKTARHMLPLLSRKTQLYTAGSSASPFSFNPLVAPPGVERSVYLAHVVDLVAQAFTLGDGARSVLQKAISACFAKKQSPTLADVLDELEGMKTRERQTGWKLSAMRAIESLSHESPPVDAKSQRDFAHTLVKHNTIIELDGLSHNARKFFIPLVCSWVYSVRLASASREKLRLVIVFEEAHHVLYRQEHRSSETLMNQLLRQGRELGIGCVVVDQHPHLISSAALGNCYTTICLNLKDPTDINKASGLSLVDESQKHHFSMLPVGHGIVKMQDRWQRPFVVQFPLVPLKKGIVTDSMVGDIADGTLTLSQLRERARLRLAQVKDGREYQDGNAGDAIRSRLGATVEEGASRLLCDVVLHPHDGVDRRYKRLDLSGAVGNRWKEQLVASGLVTTSRQKVGRTYRVLLSPTARARSLLAARKGDDPQASFTHEYWKRSIAGQLRLRGYLVTLESPRTKASGYMDILVVKQSRKTSVEIETGMSDVVSNVKRDLLEGVNEVVVLATSDMALQKIEGRLAKAGLLIEGRVVVAKCDDEKVIEDLWIDARSLSGFE